MPICYVQKADGITLHLSSLCAKVTEVTTLTNQSEDEDEPTTLDVSDFNDTLRSRLVSNQCQPKTTLAQESLSVLPEFGIPLAKTQIQHQQIYCQSAVFGQTVHNFGSKARAAIEEIESLTNEVLEILDIKRL